MIQYLKIVDNVLKYGERKLNRTGVDTISVTGEMFTHDMRHGFPLLTIKKINLKRITAELEWMISGTQSKQFLHDRNNHTWDHWCNPQKVPYGHDAETKANMKAEMDLGRVYGVQWRGWRIDGTRHIDQLWRVIEILKKNPTDRRMIVTAWNPGELDEMALPPCHYSWQLVSDGEFVDLIWIQRSVDVPIGLPYDIALYGMLLELIAATVGMKARYLVGQLGDTHIYMNQIATVEQELMVRQPRILPWLELPRNANLFTWKYDEYELHNYNPRPAIKFEIAV